MNGNSAPVSTRNALVLYGTETGNAQDIAHEVGQVLERIHFPTDVFELDHATPQSLLRYSIVVFVLSTTGQGEFPSNARKFWLSLLRRKLPVNLLNDVSYSVVGLCDSSYPKFNFAARKLDKRLRQLGADRLVESCEADEQDGEGTEGTFLAWLPTFTSALLQRQPLAEGQEPIPNAQRLTSKWTLRHAQQDILNGHNTYSNGNGHVSLRDNQQAAKHDFQVRLTRNERVTPSTHWQDVRFLQLETDSPVFYMPGDALAIKPQNLPDDVERLLDILGWTAVADDSLIFHSNSLQSFEADLPDAAFRGLRTFTLRKLLTEYLDINAIPKRSFFATAAYYTENETHRDRLREFADPEFLDEYFDYATRSRRSILETLPDFPSLQIPWQEALSIFPVLRPRQFSVASGGKAKKGGSNFDLLVAIVKYRTVIKRIREGVCTRYLAQLPIGTTLNVSLSTEGRFSTQTAAMMHQHHLLIGGGTGIAPLRAVIQEKHANTQNMASTLASTLLVYGCRNATADYFFSDEWKSLNNRESYTMESQFQVLPAFSRDQARKIYVQDTIRANAEYIRSILLRDNVMVIVCGSSGNMPKAVRQALLDTLTSDEPSEIHMSTDDAELFLAKLEKLNKYKQETW